MKFRKKPVVIDAFRLGVDPMPDWFCVARTHNEVITHGDENDWRSLAYADIKTEEGVMRANREDWIIRGVQGELYPCKPDIFQATYERVAESESESR